MPQNFKSYFLLDFHKENNCGKRFSIVYSWGWILILLFRWKVFKYFRSVHPDDLCFFFSSLDMAQCRKCRAHSDGRTHYADVIDQRRQNCLALHHVELQTVIFWAYLSCGTTCLNVWCIHWGSKLLLSCNCSCETKLLTIMPRWVAQVRWLSG